MAGEQNPENNLESPETPPANPDPGAPNLPDQLADLARQERELLEAEQRQIDTWRLESSALLKDRDERRTYFADLAAERETRFKLMLDRAHDQLAGVTPRPSHSKRFATSTEPSPRIVRSAVGTMLPLNASPCVLVSTCA